MRRFVEGLSGRAEFWLVLALACGYFVAGSTLAFLRHHMAAEHDFQLVAVG